jgi:integrase/recombinase XerD
MGSPDRVRVTGPLAAFSSGFAAELVQLGYRANASADLDFSCGDVEE